MKKTCLRRIAFFLPFLLMTFFYRSAYSSEAFVVEDIAVVTTEESAHKGREKALMEASKKGLMTLAERQGITLSGEVLDRMDSAKIQETVQSFEITKEKASSLKYQGTFKITFKSHALKNLIALEPKLKASQEAVSDPRHCLILPVFETQQGTKLWGDDNPWFDAWSASPLPPSLSLPLGDLSDMKLISADTALNTQNLKRLMTHYDVSCVIVAKLSEESRNVYTLEGHKVTQNDRLTSVPHASPLSGQDLDTYLRTRVAHATESFVQDNSFQIKQSSALNARESLLPKTSKKIMLRIQFKGFDEWQNIQKSLTNLPGVHSVFIERLGQKTATVSLMYTVLRDDILNTLKAHGFDVMGEPSQNTENHSVDDSPGHISRNVEDNQPHEQSLKESLDSSREENSA